MSDPASCRTLSYLKHPGAFGIFPMQKILSSLCSPPVLNAVKALMLMHFMQGPSVYPLRNATGMAFCMTYVHSSLIGVAYVCTLHLKSIGDRPHLLNTSGAFHCDCSSRNLFVLYRIIKPPWKGVVLACINITKPQAFSNSMILRKLITGLKW